MPRKKPLHSSQTAGGLSLLRALACAGLLAAPLGAWAQVAGEPPALQDWRAANDAVAQFKRGHIDLLKWERANPSKVSATPEVAPDLVLDTPAEAVFLAWRRHPDLKRVQDVLGRQVTQEVAEGRLDALDTAWQRRVDDLGEWLEVATQARKAWIEAVAARKVVRFREAALTSAEAGSELARRMVGVGNWSPLQAAPLELAMASARMDLRRAQLAAAQAQMALTDLLGMGGSTVVVGLPSALPDVPASAMARSDWAGRLAAMQRQLPGMSGVRNRAASQAAFEVYSASHELAQIAGGDVLRLRRFVTEETVLHYNGMLKSVWDLLGEVRNQAAAEVEAIGAQRDFWLAEADLQWTLQGGVPARPVSLEGGSASSSEPAAH